MDILTPCLYAEYGRYIGRFRQTPYYKDTLKIVQRRLMLVMSTFPRNTLKKSARVIGETLGNYHPHGDMSVYDALLTLVNQGYVHGRGNWGGKGKTDDKQAAYRYTECFLKSWVYDLAFEFSSQKYIDWEDIEYELEPIYLASPISLGLIGNGIITGISFYKTIIPKYKLIDLAKRLEWILRKNNGKNGNPSNEDIPEENYDIDKYGPIIKPFIKDCKIFATNKEFHNILTIGKGTFKTIPYGELKKCNRNMSPTGDYISVKGRSPNVTFSPLIKATVPNEKTKEIKLDLEIKAGNQKENELIRIFPRRKKSVNGSMKNIIKDIWENYLIKDIRVNCLVCIDENVIIDGEKKVIVKEEVRSIDQLLIYSYIEWRNAFLRKRIYDFEKEVEKYFSLCVLKEVREIFIKEKSKTVKNIIEKYFEKNKGINQNILLEKYDIENQKYIQYNRNIQEKDIHDCVTKNSTKRIIEIDIDTNTQIQKIIECKNNIANIDNDAYNRVLDLSQREIEYA